jgi:murein DD-endopeptidase MepM/ murein hydrolase activator NlpD
MSRDRRRDRPPEQGVDASYDPSTWLKKTKAEPGTDAETEGEGRLSLDPKTWTKPASPSGPPEPESASDSFDPGTWRVRPGPGEPAPSPAGFTIDRRWLLAASGALALGGGLAALAAYRRGKTSIGPNPAAGHGAAASFEAQDVDGLPALRARLTNFRISPDQANLAVAALRSKAGADPGRMHLTLRLAGAAQARPRLTWLEVRRVADGSGFQLTRVGDGFSVAALAAELTPTLVAHPRLQVNRDGLYASAVGDLDAELMKDFAEAMAFDFDFAAEVREGDQFEVVHREMRDRRGDPVGRRKLLFAFLGAGGKDRYLYRFTPPGADEGWFDDRGRSNKRAFMRTPLDGARITSLFGERKHPVFHDVRMHKGVDFGCKIGTHVFAAADGVVDYAGPATGFGVVLKLKHAGGLETWYGHLSGFPDGIRVGEPVRQGQFVALSGNVGYSTGPHLHYETHKDGVAVDPENFLRGQEGLAGAGPVSLTGAAMEAFQSFKQIIDKARREA